MHIQVSARGSRECAHLEGKNCVVLCNIKTRSFGGLDSQGMILFGAEEATYAPTTAFGPLIVDERIRAGALLDFSFAPNPNPNLDPDLEVDADVEVEERTDADVEVEVEVEVEPEPEPERLQEMQKIKRKRISRPSSPLSNSRASKLWGQTQPRLVVKGGQCRFICAAKNREWLMHAVSMEGEVVPVTTGIDKGVIT